jgi:4-amino-4-deoxy-L-arabinose transferase-like glycosyltransferase
MPKPSVFLVSVLVAGMLLRWLLLPPSPYSAYDELGYSYIANNLIATHFVPLPESSFFILSTGGYFFAVKPPLLVYLLAIAYYMFGSSLEVGRLAVAFAGLLAIVPLFYLAKMIYNVRVAVVSTLIFTVIPVNAVIGSLITPTPVAALLTTCAVYYLVKEHEAGKGYKFTFVFLFLSLLTEVWGLLVVAIAALLLIWNRARTDLLSIRNLVLLLAAMTPFWFIALYPLITTNSTPLVSHSVSSSTFFGALQLNAREMALQLLSPEIISTPVTVSACIGLAWVIFKRRRGDKLMIVVLISSLAILLIGTTLAGGFASTGRYLIPFTPYIAILAAIGICDSAELLSCRRGPIESSNELDALGKGYSNR